jgi:uncharacterized sulfatase
MRPNFVFIMTDTQSASVIGAYGKPEVQTPNLDRLAAQGVRFDRAYTTCPVCTPARGAIFTGNYPHFNGAWANSLVPGVTIRNMGQRFRDNGYRTAYAGKWHLSGLDYYDTGICPDGWDDEYWYDGRRYLNDLGDEKIKLWRETLGNLDALHKHEITAEFTWAHRVSDRGIKFLQKNHKEPFLLVCSYDEPHGPSVCPPEYVERFKSFKWQIGPNAHEDFKNKPASHRLSFESNPMRCADGTYCAPFFFGCNSFVDAEIGRVLAAVDQYAPPNTYVIFTSDHGAFMGAHGFHSKALMMYEETAHIPLIIRSPKGAHGGRADSTLVSHIDLLPTMLELAGVNVPEALDGESLVPILNGGASRPEKDVFIEWGAYDIDQVHRGGFMPARCIVSGKHKFVVNLLDTDELYDLERDPHELENRIDDPQCAAIREQLHDKLLAWMERSHDPFRGPNWEWRPWRANRRQKWNAPFIPRRDDGYLPEPRSYSTGKPFPKGSGR